MASKPLGLRLRFANRERDQGIVDGLARAGWAMCCGKQFCGRRQRLAWASLGADRPAIRRLRPP